MPSAVPEKGEKEDKGDGNFPCERRRESLILQWRMEIENREPHLVPTYFCCAIQKKPSRWSANYYSSSTIGPNLIDLRFHRLFLDSLLKAVKFENKSLMNSWTDHVSKKTLKLSPFPFLGASDCIAIWCNGLLKTLLFASFSKKALSIYKPLYNGNIISHLILYNEEENFRMYFDAFLLKLKRGKWEEVAPKRSFCIACY